MNDVKKMFRTIVNGQSAMKQELLGSIEKLDKKIDKAEKNLARMIKENTKRVDKIGKGLAFMEDDTPTVEDFDKLDKRVTKLEGRAVKN